MEKEKGENIVNVCKTNVDVSVLLSFRVFYKFYMLISLI